MKVDLSPAPLNARIGAGAVDAVALLILCAAYILVPALTLGIVLPMWGVLAAIIGYSVVPLAAFRQTLGFRLFKLELVTQEGHAVNIGDVLFRELIGRGWFPLAFIFNLLFSFIAQLMGVARFAMPTGMGALFFFASCFALAIAILGHALVMTSKDRRSIADLMARSFVVPMQNHGVPTDADEILEAKSARGRRVRGVVIAELLIIAFGLGTPWLLTRKTESTAQHTARLLREKLEAQAKANPGDEAIAHQLERALEGEGRMEEAAALEVKLQAARNQKADQHLVTQLSHLDQNPGDEEVLLAAMETLEDRGRLDEARARYEAFLKVHPESPYRAGYAEWLSMNGFTDEAVSAMRALMTDDPDFDGAHKLMAEVLVRAKQLPEAQLEYQRELVLDPDDEDAQEGLGELDQQLGPLPKAKLVALTRELKGKKH